MAVDLAASFESLAFLMAMSALPTRSPILRVRLRLLLCSGTGRVSCGYEV